MSASATSSSAAPPSGQQQHQSSRQTQRTPASVQSSTNTRSRLRPFFDNVPASVSKERQDNISHQRRIRPAFQNTPGDREASRLSKSGRQLTELEILQEKHEPEFRQVVPIIADALTSVVQQHSVLAKTAAKDDRFSHYETNTVPGILIEDYVHRIAEYTYISPTTLVVTLMLLDRLCDRYPQLLVTQLNIFKLFFVATRVASKVNDLRTLNNKHFASVGGISNKHLNELEARFLIDLRFDLFVSPREFLSYAARISPQTVSVPRAPSTDGAGPVARIRNATATARGEAGLTSTTSSTGGGNANLTSTGDDVDHVNGGENVSHNHNGDRGGSDVGKMNPAPTKGSGGGSSENHSAAVLVNTRD
jgi:hypothetical protein